MFEVGYMAIIQSMGERIGIPLHFLDVDLHCNFSVDELFRVLLRTFQPCALRLSKYAKTLPSKTLSRVCSISLVVPSIAKLTPVSTKMKLGRIRTVESVCEVISHAASNRVRFPLHTDVSIKSYYLTSRTEACAPCWCNQWKYGPIISSIKIISVLPGLIRLKIFGRATWFSATVHVHDNTTIVKS